MRKEHLFEELNDYTVALIRLAEFSPERTTLAQMTFFLLAAKADLLGKPATFTEIKEQAGPVINRSLHTTYQVFLDKPLKRYDYDSKRTGLAWLTREENPNDNRQKFLRLTPSGQKVLEKVLSINH